MSSIAKSDFHAALDRLEAMAKGSQLHHTSSDSVPGSHAGVNTSDYQDEHKDGIDENGTDYNGVKKALASKVEKSRALTPAEVAIVKGSDPRPFIVEKIGKGQSLTPAESWVLKGGYAKMKKMEGYDEDEEMAYKGGADKPGSAGSPGEQKDASSVPDTHAGENEDGEIEADAMKSLYAAASKTDHLRKGLEMSPILVEFTRAMGEALKSTETRTANAVRKSLGPIVNRLISLEKSLGSHVSEQGEFNKGFAETLVGVGQHVAGNAEIDASRAHQAAGAPKSQLRALPGGQAPQGVQAVQKSFGPGGLEVGTESLAKAQITDTMCELVKSGKLNSLDVIKYESTGEINPQVQQMVLAQIQGAGQ